MIAEELAAAGIALHLAEPAGTAFARGRKRHAKTGKTGCRHLRMLLAEGRLPECWIPPGHILECRAPARRSGSPGRGVTVSSSAARTRPGGCPGRDRPCCAGRCTRPTRPTPGPRPPTTAATPRSKTASAASAALSEARKIRRQACHILTELGGDAPAA
jgi:hypothetical protein